MVDYNDKLRIQRFLAAALECSFYVAPNDPGLTYDELVEAGKRISLQAGEINDAVPAITTMKFGKARSRLLPNSGALPHWHLFLNPEEPEYRSLDAFQFLHDELHASGRLNGAKNVRIERTVMLERAATKRVSETDLEVTLAICIFTGQLIEESGIIRPAPGRENFGDPSGHLKTFGNRQPMRHEARAQAYPIVKDIIERRTDGRPSAAEPFDAFADELERLGYGAFRLWWKQMAAELRISDAQTTPVSIAVLSAALVEGSLTFLVKHARTLNLSVMGSKTFEGSPTTWRIDDLVSSASAGRESAILDAHTKFRAEGLIKIRQRVHAGRMLSEFPGGPPDLRPEEAREAKATAEQVVRRVIEWLQKYPASESC